jgi:hypothetical protein
LEGGSDGGRLAPPIFSLAFVALGWFALLLHHVGLGKKAGLLLVGWLSVSCVHGDDEGHAPFNPLPCWPRPPSHCPDQQGPACRPEINHSPYDWLREEAQMFYSLLVNVSTGSKYIHTVNKIE